MKEYRVVTMHSENLDKDKRLFIYLPEDYTQTETFYPVLYMHDGQNLFDDAVAPYGQSWRIIEQFQIHDDLPKMIVVGIESDKDDRSDELIPYRFEYFDHEKAGGKADAYLDFITRQVKPYIDKRFRTLKSPKHTALMGSSFGAVNTLYAALEYEHFFSRYACLSNAYLFEGFKNPMDQRLKGKVFTILKKLYIDVGTNEHKNIDIQKTYLSNNKALRDTLQAKLTKDAFTFKIIEDGKHHESDWEKRFADIIRVLFQEV
ncbi:MAG: alpha/beta hydrolase-fold protein [Candidatus Izemoplasma sp.]|nr:alpha/beta hydrolase-fold protein [Candidatus Izemoplasma sp.]